MLVNIECNNNMIVNNVEQEADLLYLKLIWIAMLRMIFMFFTLAMSFSNAFAQINKDSVFLYQAKEVAINTFDKEYDSQLSINKGIIFRPIDGRVFDGSTYLGDKEIYKGNVLYKDEWFNNIDLVYDIKSDNLIHVKRTGEWIGLSKNEVRNFSLGNRNFINLESNGIEPSGFYELIFSDKIQVLAKHSLDISTYNTQTSKRDLTQVVVYMINNNNVFYVINSRNDLLRAFKDKRNEIVAFLKTENLDVKKSPEMVIKEVIIFYNKLK